jgi:hypothetical protein
VTDKTARLMVLVDGENFHAQHVDELLNKVRPLGAIVEVRVYGHAAYPAMSAWEAACKRHGLTFVEVAAAGQNSADFHLTIEAIDILHTRSIDAMCIVSSDAGFTSLALRIRAGAVRAYGIGELKVPDDYRKAFDRFIAVPASPKVARQKVTPSEAAAPIVDPKTFGRRSAPSASA